MKTGTNIRKIRNLKGLSQEYVAAKLGMSQNNYHKIEANEIDISSSRITELAKVFEVDPATIFNFDEKYIFNNTFQNHADNNHGQNMVMHNENFEKERFLYEKLISSKEMEIVRLEKLIEFLNSNKSKN